MELGARQYELAVCEVRWSFAGGRKDGEVLRAMGGAGIICMSQDLWYRLGAVPFLFSRVRSSSFNNSGSMTMRSVMMI